MSVYIPIYLYQADLPYNQLLFDWELKADEAGLQNHLPDRQIYIGTDAIGSCRYFGGPDMDLFNADFQNLPDEVRKDYSVRKPILWESEEATDEELSAKEVELIREYQSHNPNIGYN